jgi:hypothetical protein
MQSVSTGMRRNEGNPPLSNAATNHQHAPRPYILKHPIIPEADKGPGQLVKQLGQIQEAVDDGIDIGDAETPDTPDAESAGSTAGIQEIADRAGAGGVRGLRDQAAIKLSCNKNTIYEAFKRWPDRGASHARAALWLVAAVDADVEDSVVRYARVDLGWSSRVQECPHSRRVLEDKQT